MWDLLWSGSKLHPWAHLSKDWFYQERLRPLRGGAQVRSYVSGVPLRGPKDPPTPLSFLSFTSWHEVNGFAPYTSMQDPKKQGQPPVD